MFQIYCERESEWGQKPYDLWVRGVFRTSPWTLRQRGRSALGCLPLARWCRSLATTCTHPRLSEKEVARLGGRFRIAQQGAFHSSTDKNKCNYETGYMLTSSAVIVTV